MALVNQVTVPTLHSGGCQPHFQTAVLYLKIWMLNCTFRNCEKVVSTISFTHTWYIREGQTG